MATCGCISRDSATTKYQLPLGALDIHIERRSAHQECVRQRFSRPHRRQANSPQPRIAQHELLGEPAIELRENLGQWRAIEDELPARPGEVPFDIAHGNW